MAKAKATKTAGAPVALHSTSMMLIDDIKFSPYNPRRINPEMVERLKKSVVEFGLVDPIIVNKRNSQAVGGNQRLRVLRDLGVTETTVVLLDLDDARERALNLALNKIGGDWDFDKLASILSGLDDMAKRMTGFDLPEIDLIVQSIAKPLPFEAGEEGPPDGLGIGSGGGGPAGSENAAPGSGQPETGDGLSFVVYVSFSTKEDAEQWLAEQGVAHEFKNNNRTFVLRK